MDVKRKLELEKEIARVEREKNRSLKWFFINLLASVVAIVFAGLILWLVPKGIETIMKSDKLKMLKVDGTALEKMTWAQQARLDYIKWGMFVFVFAWVTTCIFWALFRFRKWTNYQHKIDVLKEELKNLEKEK